jgi:cobyric acid synthase
MLGETLLDPGGLESDREKAPGLGLLPLSSELAPDKTLKLVRAEHAASGLEMRGYEIHHGVSEAGAGSEPVVCAEDGRVIGHGVAGNRVWGTYLHGAFDADEFRRWFLDRLREHKGLAPLGRVVAVYDLEPALDRLADTVRERLDMELIYSLAGL